MLKALIYAYVLGGLTFIPLVILAVFFITIYTSVPVGEVDVDKKKRGKLESKLIVEEAEVTEAEEPTSLETNDLPRTRKGWLTMRRTFEESLGDGGYVNIVRSFLDSRSKDPKKSRPKDMWYVVLKGKVLYLYEDEDMVDCGAVVELGGQDVIVYPEGQTDGEMFAKRNAICLKPKGTSAPKTPQTQEEEVDADLDNVDPHGEEKEKEKLVEGEKERAGARGKELIAPDPWFIFVRSTVEMEDWYLALIHASDNPAKTPTLQPLEAVFRPADMNHLVSTLDEQPDVIPMRWFNALIGRVFFSHYRTHALEANIIGRLMKKLSKVKRPTFLTDVVVTEVSVGNRPPMFSKPMLKELTKEGDASLEVHVQYKGEVRITIEATAIINLGQFRSYTVKLVLAAVLKELEGNLLVKIKRPPSDRIWYAFTQNPRMVLQVEPIVSDRQIKWGMILSTIESKLKEIIQESVVMPYMDDIAFFDSSPYGHRGGIWSDASRSEKPEPSPPESIPGEMHSTVSAPPIMSSESSSSRVSSPGASVERPLANTESEGEESRPASVIPVLHEQDIFVKGQPTDQPQSAPVVLDAPQSCSPSVNLLTRSSTDAPPEIREAVEEASDDLTLEPSSSRSRTPSVYSVRSHNSGKSPELPGTPRKSLEESREVPTSPTPSSFLSTLKSKAGDKQALGNTARETMRKWGVNWSNLKKEFTSDENGDIVSKLRDRMEGSRIKRDNNPEGRVVVEERHDRERNSGAEEEGVSSRSASPEEDAKHNDGLNNEQQGAQLNAAAISQQTGRRLFTAVSASNKKSHSPMSQVSMDIDGGDVVSEEEVRPLPIQAQPQAKTMMIPGIHASHKGDVMSIGSVAPAASPLPDPTKTKNPAIQSMYRLWRNPTTGGGQEPSTAMPAKPTALVMEVPQPQPSLLRPTSPTPATPPPLPPRRTSVSSPGLSEQDQPGSERSGAIELVKVRDGETISDVHMDSISEVESATHSSPRASTTINTPPPLPPRRISSTA